MEIKSIKSIDNNLSTRFGGTRVLKNTVSQLAKNNKYSLNEPNQRYITKSIEALGKLSDAKVIDFLIKTAENLKYGTNIRLKDKPQNNWKSMLLAAAAAALAITPIVNQTEFAKKIQELSNTNTLNKNEKEILKLRDELLSKVDIEQIQRETVGGIKDFEKNLDYFIISSETTLAHKKYILSRLNYLMSSKYKINTQLKDKKSIVAAELVNDMAIYTPGHKVPNIKAVNQKQHGMCAAISIVRKKIAYEAKADYIDSILSELDNTEFIKVYDRSALGSGKKIMLRKVPVDFEAALSKGYRIIDASATQWMQIAHKSGYSGNSLNNYTPFDKENFDIYADAFFNTQFEEPDLKDLQAYYQSLVKAGEVLNDYKADKIKRTTISIENKQDFKSNSKALNDTKNKISEILSELSDKQSKKDLHNILVGLLKLEKKYSSDISVDDKFSYIVNEEDVTKKNKIKEYLINNKIPEDKINNASLDRLYNLVEDCHFFEGLLYPDNQKLTEITKATRLYEIGAGARYQFIQGLKNEITLNYIMKKENVPHKEQCLKNLADKLIEKLNTANNSDSEEIKKSLQENTGLRVKSDKDAIKLLNEIKQRVNTLINQEANKVYKSINLHNKTDALIEQLSLLQLMIANNNDAENLMLTISENLGIKNSQEKILSALDDLKDGLSSKKYKYDDVYNKLGSSSEIIFLNDIFQNFVQKLPTEEGRSFLESFIINKGLDLDNIQDSLNKELNKILNKINNISDELDAYSNMMKIRDAEGNLLYSPEPADIIIKKLENNGTIPSEKALKELQNHLNKIQKDRSEDEFSTRKGKLSKKSLGKFSNNEKYTLSKIERNLNPLTQYIKKQMTYIQQYIKTPLEELKRMIGLDMGNWWVSKDGDSGLQSGQDIRVLEYITGIPHHTTNRLKEAIEKIKTSPYSGISSSSVFHDKIGMHAQYIADIEPVEITDENGNKKVTDVLYQDNSWGASEHENTWVDSNGLTRTDYSDYRGGTLGYITNNKFRNGNFVKRVLNDMVLENEPDIINSHQYKKLRKNYDSEYNAPQYSRIALEGLSPDAKTIADSIHDVTFLPSSRLIDTMKSLTKDMSAEEVKNRLHRIKNFKNEWENISDRYMKRILDKEISSAIKTKEDYDRLPDNDPLKIALEKTAFLNNYSVDDFKLKMSSLKNVKELAKYRNMQKQRAIKDFEYSFGKNIDIIDFLGDELEDDDYAPVDDFIKKYKIDLTDEEFADIFYILEIEKNDFDGSLKHTIDHVIDNIIEKFKDKLKSEKQEKELKKILFKIYSDKLYFNSKDINKPEVKHIIGFIDRVYNPDNNAELVKIYKKLQDTNLVDFKKKIVPLLTNEDLNIKDQTGFDILKNIQHYEEDSEDDLNNMIYIDEIKNKTENSIPYVEYTQYKLYRTPKIMSKYNFDSAYREMKNDLSLLKFEKLFGKYKALNLNKYGAYPAYPKIDYMPDRIFNTLTSTIIQPIIQEIDQIDVSNVLKECYTLSDKLKNFIKQFDDTHILSDQEFEELNIILGKMCTLIYNDDSMSAVYDNIIAAMETDAGKEFKHYKKYMNKIIKNISEFEKNISINALEQGIEANKILISKQTDMLVKTYIRKRYQDKFYQTFNNYKKSLITPMRDENGNDLSDIYMEQLQQELKEYNVLQEPVELLDRYIESLPKDSELNRFSVSIESALKLALDFAKLCDMQSTLMSILDKGIETDVKKAFSDVKIRLNDGTYSTMDSDSIITNMVHSLVYDENEDTALMFLEKLGLNETYVNNICDNFDENEFKTMLDESANKQKLYKEFTVLFNNSFKELTEEINNGKNPIRSINKFKKTLIDGAKQKSIEKTHLEIFLSAIDLCKDTWKNNPFMEKSETLETIFYDAGEQFNNQVAKYINSLNGMFETHEGVMHLLNNVLLNTTSEASLKREELNKKYNKLVLRYNKMMQDLQAIK